MIGAEAGDADAVCAHLPDLHVFDNGEPGTQNKAGGFGAVIRFVAIKCEMPDGHGQSSSPGIVKEAVGGHQSQEIRSGSLSEDSSGPAFSAIRTVSQKPDGLID